MIASMLFVYFLLFFSLSLTGKRVDEFKFSFFFFKVFRFYKYRFTFYACLSTYLLIFIRTSGER